MGRNVSAIVSGLGFGCGFLTALDKERQKLGISEEDFHVAIKDDSPLIKRFADLIAESCKPKFSTYRLSVDYDRSVEDGIAAGKYDWTNDNITQKNFPSNRKSVAEVDVQLVPFGRVMTTDAVARELDKLGLRPAELPELLTLGERHPDLQREFPIIALGSRWRYPGGDWSVPCLSRYGAERGLDLGWVGRGGSVVCRFAAVSK